MHAVALKLCVLARHAPNDLRTRFVVESENVGPVGIKRILAILAVDDVLTDGSTLAPHLLVYVRFGVEIELSLHCGGSGSVDGTRFLGSQFLLYGQSLQRHCEQRIDESKGLLIGCAWLDVASCSGVKRHAAEEVKALKIEIGHERLQLCEHRLACAFGESQFVEIYVLKVFKRIPRKGGSHLRQFPSLRDARHVISIFMVVELLVVSAVKPIATSCWQHELIGAELL